MNQRDPRTPMKRTPEEVALIVEASALLIAHPAGWIARGVQPAVAHLASDAFQRQLELADQGFSARVAAPARHARQIAAEFER